MRMYGGFLEIGRIGLCGCQMARMQCFCLMVVHGIDITWFKASPPFGVIHTPGAVTSTSQGFG